MFLKPRTYKDLLLHLGLIAFLSMLFLFCVFKIYLPSFTHHGETVTVSNLVGKGLSEAKDFLDSRHLRYKVMADSGYNEKLPPNAVLSHIPEAGKIVKENRVIFLKLNSENPPMVPMPNLQDLSIQIAEIKLHALGLKIGKREYAPDGAHNAILQQKINGDVIQAGTNIHKGTAIDLVIGNGLGGKEFEMPNLVGTPFDEVEMLAIGSMLTINLIQEETDNSFLRDLDASSMGVVTRQTPQVGEMVKAGQSVDVWVYKYKEFVEKMENER